LAFEPAWATLQQELRQWKVHQLEFQIERPLRSTARRVWTDAEHRDNGGAWSLEMRFDGPSGTRCQLKVAALDPHDSEPWYLLRIARLMKTFGQHWAARADLIGEGDVREQPQRRPAPSESLPKAA